MTDTLKRQELLSRIERLHALLKGAQSTTFAAFIADKVNQYYFTGTLQDGLFVLLSTGDYVFFVRNSHERALAESPLPAEKILPMASYKDIAAVIGGDLGVIFLESEVVTHAMLGRLSKYFNLDDVKALDRFILAVRAVKSESELAIMREAGRLHAVLLEEKIPALMRAGMNEAEFTADIYSAMLALGHHGVSRFSMFQMHMVIGQLGFGENSLYPTNFDGAGGMRGLCPAVPSVGDRSRTLRKGDLVFVDVGFGIDGYHTDRTQIYSFAAEPSAEAKAAHSRCLQVQKSVAAMLKPGAIPAEIYTAVVSEGFENRNVKFLGHGVGLYVDEFPVIASGFTAPLEANMTIALEPKIGIEGGKSIGLVGGEDTYVVTPSGGECLTGGEKPIMVVDS
ncbi:MAG: Xaa-Pro peptidase family protein [Oscillospiraceae bacterium]|nr:Xaa-Pro peptidase family protein [Oscillospiraceae bacterium]